MPDFKVRFIGDLGNLAAFDRAIRNSAVESTRQLENANRRVASTVGPLAPSGAESGILVQNQRTIVDSYNRTFRQTGEIVRRSIKDYKAAFDEATGSFVIQPEFSDAYLGKFDKTIGDLDRYERAIKRVAGVEKLVAAQRESTARKSAQIQNQILQETLSLKGYEGQLGLQEKTIADPFTGIPYSESIAREKDRLLALQSGDLVKLPTAIGRPGRFEYRSTIENRINEITEQLRPRPGFAPPAKKVIDNLLREQQFLQEVLRQAPLNVAKGARAIEAEIANYRSGIAAQTGPLTTEIARLKALIAQLEALDTKTALSGERKVSRIRGGKNAPLYAEVQAAALATPPIDKNLATALAQSKDLRSKLLASGLGEGAKYGTPEFQAALAAQGASVNRFVTDVSKGITRVSGEWIPQTGRMRGVTQEFTVELDRNQKVVGRWGGQLAGAGQALNQTVRNFQKVVQWTVATTLVFGALGTVITSLSTINELNASLERLSITAQISATQTQSLFKDLAQIGYDTATPLKEIVKVADDIALATREANQSGEEWRQGILDLTRVVGIFTNLTGTDTVQAADVLNSTFKQLDIDPSGLIGVLNKVTAVAGGQSTAINEIVTALGSVAEAGKVAGLSIDEQIASVQVLGQVTNKSAADVATAFKNLFGSVDSVGARKILKEFGISVRDEQGNLKGFLDIYREIAEAREQGIIPEGRFKEVLKGISGGPRRSPDAAALIANIDLIDQAIAKSQGATNEALIANAKILDTNQAKIVQFQNAFDTAIFERFGQAVENLTRILTDFGTAALKIFGALPPSLIELAIQFGILVTGARIFGGLIGKLRPTFEGMGRSAKLAAADLKLYNAQTKIASGLVPVVSPKGVIQYQYPAGTKDPKTGKSLGGQFVPPTVLPPTYQSPGTRLSGFLSNPRNTIGLAAGAGIGLYAADQLATGKQDVRGLGGLISIGGTLATLVPGLQVAGIASIALGTAMQFLGAEAEESKKSAAELAQEIFGLTQRLSESQTDVVAFTTQQREAARNIDELRAKQKLGDFTADDQARLTNETTKYVDATLALVSANRQAAESMKELLRLLGANSEAYSKFSDLVKSGQIDSRSPLFKSLVQQLSQEILTASGQSLYLPEDIEKDLPIPKRFDEGVTGSTFVNYLDTRGRGPDTGIDLQELLTDPYLIRGLFRDGQPTFGNSVGGPDTATGPLTKESAAILMSTLSLIQKEIAEGKSEITQAELDEMLRAVQDMAVQASSYFATDAALRARAINIQSQAAIGVLTPEQAANATARNRIAQELLANQQFADVERPQYGNEGRLIGSLTVGNAGITQDEVQRLIESFGQGSGSFSTANLTQAADVMLRLIPTSNGLSNAFDDVASKGEAAINETRVKLLLDMGVSAEILAKAFGESAAAVAGLNEEIELAFSEANATALQRYSERKFELIVAENSGQYKDNAAGLRLLNEQNLAAYQSSVALNDAMLHLSAEGMAALREQLAELNGLELANTIVGGEMVIKNEELGNTLIENAVKAGVNAEGIRKLTAEAALLFAALENLPTYKRILIEISTFRTGETTDSAQSELAQAQDEKNARRAYEAAKEAEQRAIEAGTDPSVAAQKFIDLYNKLINQATGSQFGQLPKDTTKTTPYNKPGLLDIPEELLKQPNFQELLRQAVANARNLQGTFPGEVKENKDDIVALLNGTQKILQTRGIGEEYLRRALDELTEQVKKQNEFLTKADTIRRIRVGGVDFASLANVPVNTKTGVSLGGPQGPINVSLNLNGTVLTPAQFAQFADMVAAAIKRQIAA